MRVVRARVGVQPRGRVLQAVWHEEEVYLSLDGTATVYVHSSVAALNALRGTSFDTDPAAAIDRAAIRDYFRRTTAASRGSGRRAAAAGASLTCGSR